MFVPEAIELRVDCVDLGAHVGVVLVGEPVPELGALLAQGLDLRMDLFQGSHDRFNARHAHDIPGESSALAEVELPPLAAPGNEQEARRYTEDEAANVGEEGDAAARLRVLEREASRPRL